MTREGNILDFQGNKIAPNTGTPQVTDVAKQQGLSQTLLNTPDKDALGYDAFSTVIAYSAGDIVYYENKLWKCKAGGHAAGAWNANDFDVCSIKDFIAEVDEKSTERIDEMEGGVIFDISEANASGGTFATYSSFSAALSAVPAARQIVGTTVRFIYSCFNVNKWTSSTVPEGSPVNLDLSSLGITNFGVKTKSEMMSVADMFASYLPSVKGGQTLFYSGSEGSYTVWTVTLVSAGQEVYAQYRLMATSWSSSASDWKRDDDNELVSYGSELVTVGGILSPGSYSVNNYSSRNYRINMNGAFGSSSSNKHVYMPVVAGEKYCIEGISTYVLRIAFATSNAATGGGVIPIVKGTSIYEIPANTNVWVSIPDGCTNLLLWRNDVASGFVIKKAVGTDLEAVKGSKNLLESGGAYLIKEDVMKIMGTQLDDAMKNVTWNTGGIKSDDGTVNPSSTYRYSSPFDVTTQDVVVIRNFDSAPSALCPIAKVVGGDGSVENPYEYEPLVVMSSSYYNAMYKPAENMSVVVSVRADHGYVAGCYKSSVLTRLMTTESTISDEVERATNAENQMRSDNLFSDDLTFRKTAKQFTIDIVGSSEKNVFSKTDPVIHSVTSDYRVKYVKVSAGDVISINVLADSHPIFNIGFSTDVPARGVTMTNVEELGSTDDINKLFFAKSDGYLACAVYSDSSLRMRYAEIKNSDFSYTKYQQKLSSLKRGYDRTEADGEKHPCFSLLVAGDPHGGDDNMQRFVDFMKKYNNYINDVIAVGDLVTLSYGAAGSNPPFGAIDGFEKVLLVVGNHDVYDYDNAVTPGQSGYGNPEYWATNAQKYAKYMANIAEWNVQSPGEGKCYYYKDYPCYTNSTTGTTYSIRLIVLDMWQRSDESDLAGQLTWFTNVLADAKENNCHVVCACHFMPKIVAGGSSSTYLPFECSWSEDNYFDNDTQVTFGDAYFNAVQDFIDGGGGFVCWLAGHRHQYTIGTFEQYPEQMYVVVGSANYDTSRGKLVVNLPYDESYDNLCVLSVDPYKKNLRLLKVGCEFDRNLKHRGNIIISYDGTPEVKYEY